MNIEAKTITVTKPSTNTHYVFTKLNDTHQTMDNPAAKRLVVILDECKPPYQLVISGTDYDTLGQWTDETLTATIKEKLGFVELE